MSIHIDSVEEREAAVIYLAQMKVYDPESGLFTSNRVIRQFHGRMVESIEEAILSYDRRQLTDCQYEPMCGWAHVRFDLDGNLVSMGTARDPPDEGDVLAQYCLVWPNTYEEGVTPYAGTWDDTVQDFHRDDPYEWEIHRGWNVFGFDESGSHNYADYRFLKTSLKVLLPDTDGSECLPDWFHIAAKDDAVIRQFVQAWDKEEYGEPHGEVMENIPVRLVIAKRPGLKPFTGKWDGAPWEDA